MLELLFENVIEITLTTSIIILLLMVFSKVLEQNFSAKWRYRVWLLLAVRLLLPINLTLASPPVQLPTINIANALTTTTPVRIDSFPA